MSTIISNMTTVFNVVIAVFSDVLTAITNNIILAQIRQKIKLSKCQKIRLVLAH